MLVRAFTMLELCRFPKSVVFVVNEVPFFYGHQEFPQLNDYVRNFEKILSCLNWCLNLGVKELTVCAFSCLIFKFPPNEIEKVFLAFRITMIEWLKKEVFDSKGVRLNVIDISSVLPKNISNLMRIIQEMTINNSNIILNIVVGHAGEAQLNALASNFPSIPDSLSKEDVFDNCMFACTYEPQLIVSNCGHRRLTDYLLMKTSSRCMLHFHTEWSKFKLVHFIAALCYFQFHPACRIAPNKQNNS